MTLASDQQLFSLSFFLTLIVCDDITQLSNVDEVNACCKRLDESIWTENKVWGDYTLISR